MSSQATFADWLASRPEAGGGSASTMGASAPSAPESDNSFFGFFASGETGSGAGGAPVPSGTVSGGGGAADWASLASLGASALRFGGSVVGGEGVGSPTDKAGGGNGPPPVDAEWTCGMTTAQRFQAFGLLLLGSLSLYFAAIFLFLPMAIFMPAKFATTFTFASIMWMAAFAVLRGPRATLRGLVGDPEKRIFSIAYVGSLLLSLYSTMFTSSYFLALIAIFLQVGAMLWYTSGSIPGGTAAMGALTSWCFGGLTGRAQTASAWAGGALVRQAMGAASNVVSGALSGTAR